MSSAKPKIDARYMELEREIKAKYRKLKKIREKIDRKFEDEFKSSKSGNETNELFRTYMGKKYRDSRQKLMIVGKATAGWDEKDDAEEFVMEKVVTGDYNSAFWRFIIKLSTELNNTDDHKDALQRIVWSNIMKIGVNDSNPHGRAHELQHDACIELLRLEIEYYQPTRLVFVTGYDYLHDILQVLGFSEQIVCIDDEKMKPEAYKLKLQSKSLVKNCSVFLTRHPQGWTLEDRECAEKAIISGRSQVVN